MRTALRARRLAGALFLLLLLSACSGTLQSTRPQLPSDLPSRNELQETPFFPQQRYQCGPAALATVLAPSHPEATPESLRDKVYVPARRGSLQVEMAATARAYGMLAYRPRPEMGALLREVAAGHPVLVMQNLGLNWLPQWHYAVVVGYDLQRRELVLRSGTFKRHLAPFKSFENTWARSGRWALVVLPPEQLPATAEPLPLLQSVHDLERSGQPGAAGQAYRAAVERWPRSSLAWMSLGNHAYSQGEMEMAEDAFRHVIDLEADNAAAWNNLAYVLASRGCPVTAGEALACALRLGPDNPAFRQSRDELAEKLLGSDHGHCRPLSCPHDDEH